MDGAHPKCWFSTDSILRMSVKRHIRRMCGEESCSALKTTLGMGGGGGGKGRVSDSSRILGVWLALGWTPCRAKSNGYNRVPTGQGSVCIC